MTFIPRNHHTGINNMARTKSCPIVVVIKGNINLDFDFIFLFCLTRGINKTETLAF